MKAITQKHPEGCALASAAMLTGRSYDEIASLAAPLGIRAGDKALYTSTEPLRRLLDRLGIPVASTERPFMGWDSLPDRALLATKWHVEETLAMWHWVVFHRDESGEAILDPAPDRDDPIRRDLSGIHPKWYIEVLK